ncbi:SIR2 family NAD-dependent protein deacylase [Angustibacter luteus]|uniref:protein acetyllysine N-acetyltransferase n=1 Tax=Angustibacter luteus TaxID=658456 RepID=A0ABW1JD75_9ACTN
MPLRSDRSSTSVTRPADVRALGAKLRLARRVLVLTGAGISAASGPATFRGAGGGYEDGELASFHHADQLPGSLDALWAFWGPVRATVRDAAPSLGHRALAAWQQQRVADGTEVTLVTENVDDLHERAGSERVHHLHGNLFRSRCLDETCGFASHDQASHGGAVPVCPRCGTRLRPEMVLSGETVDVDALWAAKRSVRYCDAFLAIGTSGQVHPASGLVRYAEDVGALTICVDPGPAGGSFQHHVALAADAALPELLGVPG